SVNTHLRLVARPTPGSTQASTPRVRTTSRDSHINPTAPMRSHRDSDSTTTHSTSSVLNSKRARLLTVGQEACFTAIMPHSRNLASLTAARASSEPVKLNLTQT